MRAHSGGVLATIIVAFVALIVLAARTVVPDRAPTIEGAIRPAATEPGLRLLPDQLECPERGRGEGPAPVAWPQLEEPSTPTNMIRGQVIPLEILLSVPENAADQDRVGFEVDLTPARDRGPAGFDVDHDVVCAFVDTTDPTTDDTAAPASVELDPTRGSAASFFTVQGLDPGDAVVVEAWAAITASGAARAGSPTATLRSRSIPDGRRLDITESIARIPVEFGTASATEDLAVSVDDGDVGATPGGLLPYEIVLSNTHPLDAVNGIQVITIPSELTAVDHVDMTGNGSGATACETEREDERVRCSATHLGPGESVTITIATAVADRSTPKWLREQGTCTPDDSDICLSVELTWEGAGGTVESVSVSEPAAVLGGDPSIALAKYELPDAPSTADTPTMEYSVISAITTPLSDVSVRDQGCEPVTFVDGDSDRDQLLDVGEEWRYRCTGPAEVRTARAVVTASHDGVSVGDVAVPTP